MIKTLHPDLIAAKHYGTDKSHTAGGRYTVKHLDALTFEAGAPREDGKVPCTVVKNKPFALGDTDAKKMRFKKNELVGTVYYFNADCLI